MKRKIVLCITMLMTLICLCFGIVEKRSYTDVTADRTYLENIYVAQLPEQFAITACEELEVELPSVPIIWKVVIEGDVEHLARTSRQLVKVLEIYKSNQPKEDQINENEIIYITSDRWSMCLYNDPISMERGFVNIPEIGEEYLVFINHQVDGLGEKVPIFSLEDSSVIAPIFALKQHTNEIVDMEFDSTYVPYNKVRENEFFVVSQRALDQLNTLKENMIRTVMKTELLSCYNFQEYGNDTYQISIPNQWKAQEIQTWYGLVLSTLYVHYSMCIYD